MRFGHNSWLGGPIDTRSMRLNCILQDLFRDTPLDHILRSQMCAPNTVFGAFGHIWARNWAHQKSQISGIAIACLAWPRHETTARSFSCLDARFSSVGLQWRVKWFQVRGRESPSGARPGLLSLLHCVSRYVIYITSVHCLAFYTLLCLALLGCSATELGTKRGRQRHFWTALSRPAQRNSRREGGWRWALEALLYLM